MDYSGQAPFVLLDGGMGQELIRRSSAPPSPLWSAKVMLDEPEIVAAVHRDFIAAGAEVITLNTYAATPRRLARLGAPGLTEELHARAIEVALQARAEAGRPVRIAGCLPPLAASYLPDLVPPYAEAKAEFRALTALQAPHVDLMLAETMSTIAEAVAATEAMVEAGLPAWTALTVDDHDGTRTRSGEPVTAAAAAVAAAGADAILVNCSSPEAVTTALGAIAAAGVAQSVPLGAYANGFVSVDALKAGGTVDVLEARTDLGPEAYAAHAMDWRRAGASIIGGCCEVGPAHITELARLREGVAAA
ncbi:MAG: homocysteine S-methyltransferase family protein [Pseudomonadota bacterium]